MSLEVRQHAHNEYSRAARDHFSARSRCFQLAIAARVTNLACQVPSGMLRLGLEQMWTRRVHIRVVLNDDFVGCPGSRKPSSRRKEM